MTHKKAGAWVKYFELSSKKKVNTELFNNVGIEQLIDVRKHAFNILNHSVPMIYLLDYTTGKYVFVSHQCQNHLDFPFTAMMDGGVNFVLEHYHPEDLNLFNNQIFGDRLTILKDIPVNEHKDYIFSFNYRVKNGLGEYVNILQRNSFIQSDENGNPLLSMGVVTNIHHYKTENPVIQLVEKVDPSTGMADLIAKNTYYLREEDKVFSKRERQILLYIADGLTSRQIADKLFISEHTVINHKRNMHHKSNTQNTAALLGFAFKKHLL
jgi:DNA-binding CsgD family transcriptional regulator